MRILQQRLLRGANLYSRLPCIVALVESALEDAGIQLAYTARYLQQACGEAVEFMHAEAVADAPGQWRVAVQYALEHVGQAALAAAAQLISATERGETPDVGAAVAALRAQAASMRLSAAAQAVAREVAALGVPVQRISEHGDLLRLGWGYRQRLYSERAIDQQMMRSLLIEAQQRTPVVPPPSHDQQALLRELRDDSHQARIPVIGVTGTNGKTTTTLMIAHTVRLAGYRTGCASTQGLALDGEPYATGDCTGYWSHRSILASPETEFAVLETARGGLLKRGLAYDRCDAGVMLNVSDDHLGLDGVDTVEQLARVKALVAQAAAVAVLNADDAHCVAARARLAAGARAMYFSMRPDNPVLTAHLAQGGDAVWLEHDTIMLCQRQVRQKVIAAAHIPATSGGMARYNIANSMAATAALAACGFSLTQIHAGLSSFESDAATNPLRSNVFELGAFHIVLDYAHNPAAYAAVATLARGLAQGQGRVLAVVTSPGDRRDADLTRIGATCAAHFDRLFVYESQGRGRAPGAAAELISAGARAAGGAAVSTFDGAEGAVQAAYRACQPGDVLVFACGTRVATLIDAIRAIDAPAAERLAQQAAPAS
ncbi:Mur ligase family protein [Duganella radicis]|uniref:Mur ligase n=1 Tax=Duganella radicis TaxID=551988 RepID=A0A6L6PTP7_9BURK|nr:Mur ligase family protein [Duganella radicis]MTV41625.1 hypothetical protein [Duganella radicis]